MQIAEEGEREEGAERALGQEQWRLRKFKSLEAEVGRSKLSTRPDDFGPSNLVVSRVASTNV